VPLHPETHIIIIILVYKYNAIPLYIKYNYYHSFAATTEYRYRFVGLGKIKDYCNLRLVKPLTYFYTNNGNYIDV